MTYDKPTIDRGLIELPSLIARQAEVTANQEAEVKTVKYNLSLAEDGETIKWNGDNRKNDLKMTVSEIRAHVNSSQTVQTLMNVLIEEEKKLALAKVRLQELVDKFDAVRKAANLWDTEMKTGLRADKFKTEGY